MSSRRPRRHPRRHAKDSASTLLTIGRCGECPGRPAAMVFFVEEIFTSGFTSYFGSRSYQPRTFVSCGHQHARLSAIRPSLGVKERPILTKKRCSLSPETGLSCSAFGTCDGRATCIHSRQRVLTTAPSATVMRYQQERFRRSASSGSHPRKPRFVVKARAVAASAWLPAPGSPTAAETSRVTIEKAFAADAPALIEVQVDSRLLILRPWQFALMRPRSGIRH